MRGFTLPLQSYDHVEVSVKGPTNEDDLSETVYVFKQGLRTDRLFYSGFAQRSDAKSWTLFPGYADVFKLGDRSSDFTNRFRPGLGYTIAMIDQNKDDAFEFTLGGVLTALDDRLLAGYSFNFGLNRPFFFIGLRLPIRT
jgi:hypothetical protein